MEKTHVVLTWSFNSDQFRYGIFKIVNSETFQKLIHKLYTATKTFQNLTERFPKF